MGTFAVYKGAYGDASEPIWDTHVMKPGGKFYANMQDDGNFVVYKGTGPKQSGESIWCL